MGNVYSGSPETSESRGFGKGFGFRTKDNVHLELIQAAGWFGVKFHPSNQPRLARAWGKFDNSEKRREVGVAGYGIR